MLAVPGLGGDNRHEQLGEFFTANAGKLERVVACNIQAPRALIEDACANAWAILLRRGDITLDAPASRG